MKILLLSLVLASTAIAAPKVQPSREEIVATVRHLQALAQEQAGQLASAQTELSSLKQLHESTQSELTIAEEEVAKVQSALDSERSAKEAALKAEKKALAERDSEKAEKEKIAAHLSKIKTVLGFALGALLALAVQYLPFGLLMPPWSLYGRVAATVGAFGLGWLIVARFV